MSARLRDLFPNAAAQTAVWDCAVAGVSPDGTGLTVQLESSRPLPSVQLEEARVAICRAYGVAGVHLLLEAPEEMPESAVEVLESRHPAEIVPPPAEAEPDCCVQQDGSETEASEEESQPCRQDDALRVHFSQKYPSAAPCLREASFSLSDNRLILQVTQGWHATRLEQLKPEMEKDAADLLGHPVRMEITALQSSGQNYEEIRAARMAQISQEYQVSRTAAPAPSAPPAERPQRRQFGQKKDPNAPMYRPKEDAEVIYGKPFAREMVKLGEVNMDSGKITAEGEIFLVEFKKLNGREKTVVMFEFSDGTGSIRASKVLPDEEAAELEGGIKKGAWVIVQGQVHYSQFDKDLVLNFSAIVKGKKAVRTDKASDKRVELHLHTNMSSMDALCDPGKALKLAASMGHKALAITDHGVVQAFPEVMKAQAGLKKGGTDIKVLYGIEAYCIDDLQQGNAVKGSTDALLTDEIVVFDTETTGLSAANCEIIEIAACIVAGGKICDRFHCYVKPTQPIPARITELTGIREDMVRDANTIDVELPRFLEFCGNRPLVAHNAGFDMAFVSTACEKLGLTCPGCSVDTVEMARALMPQLSKHKLNIIADALDLKFNHHRASDDADVLAEIFLRFIPMLQEKCGITRVDEINGALSQLRSGPDKKQKTYHLVILVKNRPGLIALYKLISDAHLKYFNRRPIIPMSELAAARENLILGSACVAGQLFDAVVSGKPWGELMRLASFYDYL